MLEKVTFKGRIVMLGYGSVGQCVLPAIPRHFDMPLDRITVLEADTHRFESFSQMGMHYVNARLRPDNLAATLAQYLQPGDLAINLTAGVDAMEVMDLCQANGVLYVDTSLQPWAEKYENAT